MWLEQLNALFQTIQVLEVVLKELVQLLLPKVWIEGG